MLKAELSVVAPMYNESAGIGAFLDELRTVLEPLEIAYEVILVDDASTDLSVQFALERQWSRLRVLSLTRNSGHQVALEAGLAVARGDLVVTMDSDGQHPPKVIARMLEVARQYDVDVVYSVQERRSSDSVGKRFFGLAYYRMVRLLTGVYVENNQADFRLVSRRVLDDLSNIPGKRVMRLLLPAIGYTSETLTYEVRPRTSGRSRYGLIRQIQMALDSVLEFSALPLRFFAAAGLAMSFLSLVWLAYVVSTWVSTQTVDGWASVMFAVLMSGGLTMLGTSLVGEYLARLYELIKNRPRYVAHFEKSPSTRASGRGVSE